MFGKTLKTRNETATMTRKLNRRDMIGRTGAIAGLGAFCGLSGMKSATAAPRESGRRLPHPFGYCLNTATIRGKKLPIVEEIELVAKAGYDAIEPWVGEIRAYVESGGSLADLKKRIDDLGLVVADAMTFPAWIVDDPAKRAAALESAKLDMDLVRQIGCRYLAAPPTGATRQTDLDLFEAAGRYHDLLEVGRAMDVAPQLELWGFSKSLSRLGEVAFVAVESGHASAGLLLDVYHIYKGGSDFTGLKLISGKAMHLLHLNDYPADPPREEIRDSDRVYPGDGVAPLTTILQDMYDAGFRGHLSLELFNPEYHKQDPAVVAETGLRKMRAVVEKAMGVRSGE